MVVVDETLLSAVDVTAGLKKEGAIVINSSKSPAELRPLLKGYEGRVCTIDAGKISEEELGKNSSSPMTPDTLTMAASMGRRSSSRIWRAPSSTSSPASPRSSRAICGR